jgi:hypothetical protein
MPVLVLTWASVSLGVRTVPCQTRPVRTRTYDGEMDQPSQQQQPTAKPLSAAPTDWQPPSPDELESMTSRGFHLVDHAYRPRMRVRIVA